MVQQMTGEGGAAAMSFQLKKKKRSGYWVKRVGDGNGRRCFRFTGLSFNKESFWQMGPLVTFCVGYQEHTNVIPKISKRLESDEID